MCNFASFVLTKDKEFWLDDSDSHEDIIEHYELHADGARGPNIVRVEISPPVENRIAPLGDWKYKTDQDTLPEWFNSAECESRTRAALARRAEKGAWLITVESSVATTGYGGVSVSRTDRGTATAGEYGTATAGDRGTATAGDGGTATAGEYGTATAGEYGTATAGEYGTATAGDGGTIVITWWNDSSLRYRHVLAEVGVDGIEPNVPYVVKDGRLVKK